VGTFGSDIIKGPVLFFRLGNLSKREPHASAMTLAYCWSRGRC